jgi:acyl-CoA synthetase (AMP-forming)/AMP-acid ligase II/acyl carrier protein
MMAAAGATCRAYGLTANDRRLNIMPFHHIQGLVGSVLASLLCGSSVVCAPAFDPAEVPRLLREYDITWFSGSPTMHQQILEAVGRDDGPRPPMLRFVRSGSAPLPSVLRDRLQAAFGVPIIESYGMTEAHQIASDPVPPSPPVAGMAPTGCDIAIRGTAGAISAEPGRLGEVVIRGTNVIPGYLGDDDSNAACFVDGWFRTGDVGTVAEDGSLLIEGRIKDMINRGGEKILPQEIEHTLARHPRVRQAAVLGLPHTELIEEVVAVVVPADGDMLDPAELRRFLASRLAPFKVPSRVFYLSSLPLTATGKIARASLRDLLADAVEQESLEPGPAGSPERATAGQPTPYEAAVSGMWAAALGVGTVGLDDDFFALGGDSLAAVKLLRMIHETLAAEFSPLALYEEVSTVAKMAKAIQERQRAGDNGDEANPPQRKDGRAL